jgi:hypothetical protein
MSHIINIDSIACDVRAFLAIKICAVNLLAKNHRKDALVETIQKLLRVYFAIRYHTIRNRLSANDLVDFK